jgi:hypothetical protein
MLIVMGDTRKTVISALCAWVLLLIAMLVVSGGEPTARDFFMVLAIGAAASIGLLLGSWRRARRT